MSVPIGDASLIIDVEQGSDEWLRRRNGFVTGSRMKDVIAWKVAKPTKANPEPTPQERSERIMYRMEIVSERLIGELGTKDVYVTDAMKWGRMNEDIARTNYSLYTGKKVQQVGMIQHPTLKCLYSPDGLVGDDGMIEIKCLEPHNHLYKIAKVNDMPDDYKPQVQMGMWLFDRQWCDFIGYDSRMPNGLDLVAVRIERDDDYIAYLESEAAQFLEEVERDLRYYLQYLPLCERICRNCGTYFTSKVPVCPECRANTSVVEKELEKPLLNLRRIEAANV